MAWKWIDDLRREAREMRAEMAVGTVVDDATRPASEPKKEPAGGLSAEAYAEYERVAARVGFAPRGLKTDEMRRFLSECGIRVYRIDAVREYLNKEYDVKPSNNRSWVWKPLRTADHNAALARSLQESSFGRMRHNAGDIADELAPYGKPVPLPVLLTVERIIDKFPDAKFYVSDEYHTPPVADPFLAVVYGESREPIVIERWDEPRFRD